MRAPCGGSSSGSSSGSGSVGGSVGGSSGSSSVGGSGGSSSSSGGSSNGGSSSSVSGSEVACNEDFSDPICALCKSGGDLVSECPLLTLTPRVHYLLTCVHWIFPSVTAP